MRVIEKKRKRFMTARKWTLLVLFIIALIITLIALFYSQIQDEHWNEQKYVKASLREYFEPSTIDYANKYVWDEVYWIVKGKTEQQVEKYVVWQDLNIIYSVAISEILSEEQFLQKLSTASSSPVEHIQPAFFRGVLCYEVQTISESKHKIYSFYTMQDGKLLDQFTIPR